MDISHDVVISYQEYANCLTNTFVTDHIKGPYKPYPKQDSNLGPRAFNLLEFEIVI